MTHTLRLPPAHAEIYQGPHADWLLTVLRRLPNLQCLVVDRLPFFDHAALLYTRRAVTTIGGSSIGPAEFPMRLLNAAGCMNATHTGLSETLLHLTSLVYLDLSHTSVARHYSVLHALHHLPNLRVLKLRGVGLCDEDVELIGLSTGLHLRSLDIRDNNLTDRSALWLLRHCFKFSKPTDPKSGIAPREIGFEAPSQIGAEPLSLYQDVNLNRRVRTRLASGVPCELPFDADPRSGITHLFLSGNKFTVTGVSDLLKTSSLRVFDAGDLTVEAPPDYAGQAQDTASRDLLFSGGLLSVLKSHAAFKMNYLRINHSVVTGDIDWDTHVPNVAELQGSLGFRVPTGASESDSAAMRHPVEADSRAGPLPHTDPQRRSSQTAELPGDTPTATFVRATARLTLAEDEKPASQWKNGDDPGEGSSSDRGHRVDGNSARPRSYSFLVEKRKQFLKGQNTTQPFLTPAQMPGLSILVLTGVPEKAASPIIGARIIQLIRCCASLLALAKDEAALSYQRPPGTSARSFEREYIRSVIAMKRIVIEMAPPERESKHIASWRKAGKSSTEDDDSEAFWTAAAGDFTFFDEDECGLPVERQQGQMFATQLLPMSEEDEKHRLQAARVRQKEAEEKAKAEAEASMRTFDVVGQIAEFRRARREAHQRALESGLVNPNVEGHWPGEVKIVRPHLEVEMKTPQDWYGNRFEKGYLYR